MGRAVKCDRCEKCFDPMTYQWGKAMAHFVNPVFRSAKEMEEHKAGSYLIRGDPNAFVDLCPDCTEAFILFMEGSPLELDGNKMDIPDREVKQALSKDLPGPLDEPEQWPDLF